MAAVNGGKINAGDVMVIRYEGPRGGPGMREMLGVTGAIVGAGLCDTVALVTDGRFSGATHGSWWRTLRRKPSRRADRGGARRRYRSISTSNAGTIESGNFARRVRAAHGRVETARATLHAGCFAKYVKLVGSAKNGAVTGFDE